MVARGLFYLSSDWSIKVHERGLSILYQDSPPCFFILKISKEELPLFKVGGLPMLPPLERVQAVTDLAYNYIHTKMHFIICFIYGNI
jgi:hypothetical protein